jgi:ABC-2 type transport system permease protein
MRREGSPWRGVGAVFLKELFDHLTSARMLVLEILMILFAGVVVYFAAEQILRNVTEDPFLFLRLFTTSGEGLLSFTFVLAILVPLMSIGLGFDAVNGEYNRRTLSRILAQPIYRDALLFGKFLAGLATLTISLVTLWLMVIGFGLIRMGVPPGGEELARSLVVLLVTIGYAGVWLALAMLFSIVFRSTASAALVTLGVWLFLAVLWPALTSGLATVIAPPDIRYTSLGLPTPETLEWQKILARFSPGTLYDEALQAVLNPEVRSLGLVYTSQLQRAVAGPLPFAESLAIAWPQIVGLIAGSIVLFVIGYVVFQRQEVRA